MAQSKGGVFAAYDPRINYDPRAAGGRVVAINPLDALLPEDKLVALQKMPAADREAFYGRVVNSVFSAPAYQQLVFDTANREFDKIPSDQKVNTGDLNRVVEEVVKQVLASRGQ